MNKVYVVEETVSYEDFDTHHNTYTIAVFSNYEIAKEFVDNLQKLRANNEYSIAEDGWYYAEVDWGINEFEVDKLPSFMNLPEKE